MMSLPECLNLVDNSCISFTALCDKKHKNESIGLLIYNMKKAIKNTFDIGNDRGKEIRRQEDHKNHKKEVKEEINDKSMSIIKLQLNEMIDSMKTIVNEDK